jgi:hypothetical protein
MSKANTMIDRSQMFEPLIAVHPNLADTCKRSVDDWSGAPEDFPDYALISDLVTECSRMLAAGLENEIRTVMEVVERWHFEGDQYVREVATIGFLEGLQAKNMHDGTVPEDFITFLGPESAFWWRKVTRFWSHGELIVDDR